MDYKDDVLIKISNLSASSNKVSVIIPCFNCESFVERCIHSLVSQTYNNFEAIIVDDGSTDTSDAVIKRFFGDQRIHQIRHTKNVGLPASRNTGIRYSTGTLIAFLDSDDWWAPTKLEAQVRVFDDSNVDICAVAAKQIYCDGSSTISTLSALSKKDLYKTLLFRNCVPGSASSIMIRKKCFDSVGLFDEEMVSTEDQDMWIRLAEKYNYVFLSTQPLVFIDKTRDQSLSRNIDLMIQGREQFFEKREKDILPEYRKLLPHARRENYIKTAMEFYSVDDIAGMRHNAWKAMRSSLVVNKHLRRSIVLFCLSFVPLSIQSRFLKGLRNKYRRRGNIDSLLLE